MRGNKNKSSCKKEEVGSKLDKERAGPGLGARHAQTVLLFAAMLLAIMMRANMSVAIVDMTDDAKPQSFKWSPSVKSAILSSFFWVYVMLQVPAGELAKRVGGKFLIAICISCNSLLCLVLPTAAIIGGWPVVCVCRILQGATQASLYPGIHHLISQWFPVEESGFLSTMVYAGSQCGVAVQLTVSGFIATAWGWKGIFYTNGVLGALWTVAYLIFGSSSPERSRWISQKELKYIQKSLGRSGEKKVYPTPWSCIFSSLPFWTVIGAHCGQNWGYMTLMTEMPTFMAKCLNVNIKNNGLFSALPYLVSYALSFPMAAIADYMITKGTLSVTHTRKLFNTIGAWGPALALIGLSYSPEGNLSFGVIFLTVTLAINAGHYPGYMLVHIDMAPNLSSTLMGITNCAANIMSTLAPLTCGLIINDEKDPAEWRKVFFVSSGIFFISNLLYIIFGTSERQKWNEPDEETDLDASSPLKIVSTEFQEETLATNR